MTAKATVNIRMLERPEEMAAVEALTRLVWPGSDVDIVPAHMLLAVVHNGGVVLGAYSEELLIGFVFGFPGLKSPGESKEIKHCSHMLGVHPEFQHSGVGFKLKRAQWQMVRKQGIDLITWTYDPLMSLNANLNIAKLGAVCNTYMREVYGEMRDGLNVGTPSDRFQVDWWVNSPRVNSRLSSKPRRRLDLAHFIAAETQRLNATRLNAAGWPQPLEAPIQIAPEEAKANPLLLVEIPSDFQGLKGYDGELALEWRQHTRVLFEDLFGQGYIVTDFVFLPGKTPRSYYVLSRGESTLGE